MAMALVQLNAPPGLRGHVIGAYSMAALGLRCVSGIIVGVLGTVLGIHHSLSFAAAVLLGGLLLLAVRMRVPRPESA
jgi:hypothetical protein